MGHLNEGTLNMRCRCECHTIYACKFSCQVHVSGCLPLMDRPGKAEFKEDWRKEWRQGDFPDYKDCPPFCLTELARDIVCGRERIWTNIAGRPELYEGDN